MSARISSDILQAYRDADQAVGDADLRAGLRGGMASMRHACRVRNDGLHAPKALGKGAEPDVP